MYAYFNNSSLSRLTNLNPFTNLETNSLCLCHQERPGPHFVQQVDNIVYLYELTLSNNKKEAKAHLKNQLDVRFLSKKKDIKLQHIKSACLAHGGRYLVFGNEQGVFTASLEPGQGQVAIQRS